MKKFSGHTGDVTALAVSDDDKFLVSGSRDKSVRVWHIDSGKQVHEHSGPSAVFTVAVSVDRVRVAFGGDNYVHVWDLGSDAVLETNVRRQVTFV